MEPTGLRGSRAVVKRNYAILPPEGIPASVLPEWRDTEARVLTSPAMGARFAMYRLELAQGGGSEQTLNEGVEGFFFVLEGRAELDLNGGGHRLGPGGFAYMKPGSRFGLWASDGPAQLVWLKKRYEPFGNARPRDLVGDEREIPGETYMDIRGLILKMLLPDVLEFDLAMNIFSFPPGFSLPITETHVMEHGLLFLQGQGLYYLGDRWREVEAGDFIWMGAYCPQSFYATGSEPARYLYYKNVRRDIEV